MMMMLQKADRTHPTIEGNECVGINVFCPSVVRLGLNTSFTKKGQVTIVRTTRLDEGLEGRAVSAAAALAEGKAEAASAAAALGRGGARGIGPVARL